MTVPMIEKVSSAAVKGAEYFILWQGLSNKGLHPAQSSCFHQMKTGLVCTAFTFTTKEDSMAMALSLCVNEKQEIAHCSSIAGPFVTPIILSVMKSIRSSHDDKA